MLSFSKSVLVFLAKNITFFYVRFIIFNTLLLFLFYTLTIYNKLHGYGDLFDRVNDPDELNNLWYSNPELRLELLDKLVHEIIGAQSLYPKKQGISG